MSSESNAVPDGWRFEKIENLTSCRIRDFGSFSTTKLIEFLDEGIPFIKSESVQQGTINLNTVSYISEEVHNLLEKSYVNSGDILFTKIGAIGRAALYKGELGVCNSNAATAKITIDESKANRQYITYQLVSERVTREFEKSIISTPPRINLGEINAMEIELPPLPEQQKIASILSSVDDVIEKTQAQIDKLKDLKTGMMQELLTKGIGHTEFKDSTVGRIPVGWEVYTLKDTALASDRYSFTGGPFGSNLKSEDYTDVGVRIIQLQNIGDGEFKNTYKIFTSEEKADELSSCNIYPGDIIMSKMGDPVARATIIPPFHERYLMASDGIRLAIDKEKFDSKYIHDYINSSPFRRQAEINSTGTTRKRIGLTELRELLLAAPPLDEQQRIAEILTSIDSKIAITQKKKAQIENSKKALMQDLLTGKVRVEA